uniref:Uncharacterized protein n=1 Tax=Trichogramma kaykai TaxID=54128 RepID=A0ABD2WFE0_9HYME
MSESFMRLVAAGPMIAATCTCTRERLCFTSKIDDDGCGAKLEAMDEARLFNDCENKTGHCRRHRRHRCAETFYHLYRMSNCNQSEDLARK